ncbi:MAG: EthD domain-containing protein [Deltaproteobacteria bacterium]|nr:EthD domain-containing protein [Deltaproteobacteria bacterium]
MEKLIYLVWKRDGDAIEAFRDRLVGDVAQGMLRDGAAALTINVSDLRGQVGKSQYMGEGKTISACVSLWLDSLDARRPIEAALAGMSARLHGYLVTESMPLRCPDRDWPDGTRSPGVTLWTAFPKPDRVTDAEFYDRWHNHHTPLSFEIHPLWEYTRNAVARAMTPDAPPYRAIVEERFRTLEDLTDPNRFFGAPENIQRVLADIATFIDLESVNNAPMSEWIVKSR